LVRWLGFLLLSFEISFVVVVLGGGTLWHVQKFLQRIILEFPPLQFSFIPPPPWKFFMSCR
jgi:hypothetical protein